MTEEMEYVLIVGSSNMDLNIYSKRFPNPGETVTGGFYKQFLGGKGANQAVASTRSGTKTIFIGKVGNDLFGDQMVSRLQNEGVVTDYIIRDSLNHSGVAFILIDENGENMISVAPGANAKLNKEDINNVKEVIKKAKTIVVQMEIPIDIIQQIFTIASQGKTLKILNPAPLKPIPIEILQNIDIIIPNEGELFRLHSLLNLKNLTGQGKEKILQAAEDISSFGVNFIIITLGKKGCLMFRGKDKEYFEIIPPKVKAVDTVGAGDCFIGVLASLLTKDEEILTAVKLATVAASIAVTRKGAQDSIPFLNEIQEKFNKLKIKKN
jgi:ribokinase